MYSTEIFFVNNKMLEIPKGVYRYNVYTFQLELIKEIKTEEEMNNLYLIFMKTPGKNQTTDFENASGFVIFSSIFNKHSFKYKDFGILLSLVENGEFIHAAYLACAALEIGCCIYGGLLSDKMNDYLDLRNPLHLPLTYMTIGNKK